VGDIIQNNREGNRFDFAFARANPNYISHSAIVIEVGEDTQGRFAFCWAATKATPSAEPWYGSMPTA